MMARTLATFYVAAAVAGLFAVFGPGAGPDGRWIIFGLTLLALGCGAVLFRWGPSWPRLAIHGPVASATGLVAIAVAVSPDPATAVTAAAVMSFIAVDACFFFNLPLAVLHTLYAISSMTAALLLQGGVPLSLALALDCVIVALGSVTRGLVVQASHASRDPLTGLANRRGFDDALQELLADADRTGQPFSAALLDLDHFKAINDTDGHQAGDLVLIRVADVWRAELPSGSVLARHGGDEFALLLPGLTGRAALAEAERLSALHPEVGVSCGVAQHVAGESAAQLMRRADAALYTAKDAGRGQCALDGVAGTQLSADLAEAVACGQIEVAFQPLVVLESGHVLGVEALARWTHPERGPVSPCEFIPLAEQHGLIDALGEHVLSTSLAQLTGLRDRTGRQLRLGVNVSVRELVDPDYPRRVAALLAVHGWPADHLVVEVTESLLASDAATVRANLDALIALGVGVALDDFGTGYSSLSRLDVLPVGHLKLDTAFTATITTSPRRAQLVASIVALADGLGLGLVAEGVETQEQHDLLRRLGCRFGQGWLYGRPMPLADLVDRLSVRPVPAHAVHLTTDVTSSVV